MSTAANSQWLARGPGSRQRYQGGGGAVLVFGVSVKCACDSGKHLSMYICVFVFESLGYVIIFTAGCTCKEKSVSRVPQPGQRCQSSGGRALPGSDAAKGSSHL